MSERSISTAAGEGTTTISRARVGENALIVAWVQQSLLDRQATCRFALGDYDGPARRRRRRRAPLLVAGSQPSVGWSVNRSIRITGRMMTVAGSDLAATDRDAVPACAAAGKLMTVPMYFPRPDGRTPLLGSCQI